MQPPRRAGGSGPGPSGASRTESIRRWRAILLAVIPLVPLLAVGTATPVLADDPSIEFKHDGDTLALEPAPNQTIRGTTTLEPGTEVFVRIRSTGETPFIKSRGTTVGPNGGFAVTFDLSDIDPTMITVSASAKNGNVTAEVEGRVGRPPTTTTRQTLDIPTDVTVTSGTTATIPVSVPRGERAVLHIGAGNEGYGVVVRIQDANEDGTVTVTFDTNAAGTPDPTIGVRGEDRFEIIEPEPALEGALPSGTYDLALATDTDTEPVAIGQLVVEAGAATTTPQDDSGAPDTLVPPLSDPFWRTTAPGIAGMLALLSGIASILVARR